MKSIDYECKFCGRKGTAHYHEDAGVENVEFWKSLLACNRCADFHSARLRLFRSITDVCTHVVQARTGNFKNREELETRSREILESSTKKLCELVSNFYRLTNLWSNDFVEVLMERPDAAWNSLEFYVSRRKKEASFRDVAAQLP